MGRLYISAENQIDGPWLLGHENLESLNNLFNEIDRKLNEALVKTIENTAKQQMEEENQTLDLPKRIAKLQRKYNQHLKFAEITFADGKTYEDDTTGIEGIINYVDTNSSCAPTELYIRTIHGNHENEFDLIINSNAGKEEVDFEYRIKCIDEEIQQKIKTLIDKWVRENKPSRSLQIWSNSIIYFVWLFGFLTALISYNDISEVSSKTGSYKLELKKQAQKIIETGKPPANVDSTLLLLLKLQSEYVPENIKAETTIIHSKGATKTFVISLIIFFISLVRPKTVIGIGKKYNTLRLYKSWVAFTYGVILLLATTLVADSFGDFIHW
jgi:hypothetical protein